MTGDPLWPWVERASWIATLAGVIIVILAFFQLRELVRHPKLEVGFHEDPNPGVKGTRKLRTVDSMEVLVKWPQDALISEPTKLWVVVVNDMRASATARDVNAEARYPKWLVPEGESPDLKEPPGMNLWQLSKQGIELNPGVAFWLRGTFRIPKGHDAVQIHAIASMRDSPPIDKMLTVHLKAT